MDRLYYGSNKQAGEAQQNRIAVRPAEADNSGLSLAFDGTQSPSEVAAKHLPETSPIPVSGHGLRLETNIYAFLFKLRLPLQFFMRITDTLGFIESARLRENFAANA